MKILFDTNIILDVFLNRQPHAFPALQLFSLVAQDTLEGLVCATTVTTIHYLGIKTVGETTTRKNLNRLLASFKVAPVNHTVLQRALQNGFRDYEDGVIYEAALYVGVDGILTRDNKGFVKADIPIFNPQELIARVQVAG
jgi:predicted nucleic acid-binding protein